MLTSLQMRHYHLARRLLEKVINQASNIAFAQACSQVGNPMDRRVFQEIMQPVLFQLRERIR